MNSGVFCISPLPQRWTHPGCHSRRQHISQAWPWVPRWPMQILQLIFPKLESVYIQTHSSIFFLSLHLIGVIIVIIIFINYNYRCCKFFHRLPWGSPPRRKNKQRVENGSQKYLCFRIWQRQTKQKSCDFLLLCLGERHKLYSWHLTQPGVSYCRH